MAEVYVHMRDADVDSAECLHSCVTMFRDGAGGVVGFEILGAIKVEIDGAEVQQPKALGEADIEKVAKALQAHNASLIHDSCSWDHCDQQFWLDNARAALSALQGET